MPRTAPRLSLATFVALVWSVGWSTSTLAQCEITPLSPSDGFEGQKFGWSTGISGDYAVVGTDEPSTSTGAAYVYKRDGLSWNEIGRLVPELPLLLANDDEYGRSVAISGRVAVVGARKRDFSGRIDRGAVYVFRRDLQTDIWEFEQELAASDGAEGDQFGAAVAIDGAWIVVGAPRSDELGNIETGSAYAFHFDGSTWTQALKLRADDPVEGRQLANAVAISGNWFVVGAKGDDRGCPGQLDAINSGSVYTFFHDPAAAPNAGWEERTKLQAQVLVGDTVTCDAAFSDNFGHSVAVSGDRLVVGAVFSDDDGTSSGSAYVYRLDGPDWVIEQKVTASDAATSDNFGRSVAIQSDLVLVGASKGDSNDPLISNNGSVYLFRRAGTSWTQEQELTTSDAAENDRFGWYVSIGGDYAAIGAYLKNTSTGAAYVFAVGIGSDCNENGIHDDCEILAEPVLDANGNGTLDSCECSDDSDCLDTPECVSAACDPKSGLCVLAINPGFCVIAGSCFPDDASNPDNDCELCVSVLSDDAWSIMDVGSPCGDPTDSICNHPDSCNGNGLCMTNPEPTGTVCADDGNECTDDQCDGSGICIHPNVNELTPCTEDGNDCTDNRCVSGQCAALPLSNGIPCGDPFNSPCNPPDTCDGAGTCLDNIRDDGTVCFHDGLFCTGEDSCQGGVCDSAGDPCTAVGLICDDNAELFNACSCDPGAEGACDDGVFCTGVEQCVGDTCFSPGDPCEGTRLLCDEATDTCACGGLDDCDDGVFCNGEEACVVDVCVSPGDPCALPTPFCDEATDTCKCLSDADCDNDLFCDGLETCDLEGHCVSTPPPCQTFEVCDESIDFCACEGFCVQDGVFCNGEEICVAGVCESAGSACALPTALCHEASHTCRCSTDGDCDDGRACTGVEFCDADGVCQHQLAFDCDGDGLFDECDKDCNGNDIPDACDIRDGTSQDCQLNGIPDECDIAGLFVAESERLSPIGALHPQFFTVVSPPKAGGEVTLRFSAGGDLFDSSEFIDVDINDVFVGRIFELGASDCALEPAEAFLLLEASVFNSIVGGGHASVNLTSSGDVDAGWCAVSFVTVSIAYDATGVDVDCNHNGVPDECDLIDGTSEDCQPNGIPDECDLFGPFVDESESLVPIDRTHPQSHTIVSPPIAVGDVTLSFSASADLFSVSEFIDVEISGVHVGRVFELDGFDCPIFPDTETLLVDPSVYNAAVAEGDVVIDMLASAAVDDVCPFSFIAVSVTYEAPQNDCNNNGVPDSCDLAGGVSQDCQANGLPDECEPDCNGNNVSDECDIDAGTSTDCQDNGVPDECEDDCNSNSIPDDCDIQDGTSTDCNANGAPDECEVDCNGTGVPDDCDIRDGISIDCDSNGIPDECDEDCNTNGIADGCEIADGTSVDCNDNGRPDECDLADGTSPDCQNNGVPDECEVFAGFSAASDVLGPIDRSTSQTHVFGLPPIAKGTVTLFFTASADLSSSVEFVAVAINGLVVGRVFEIGGSDCAEPPNTDTLTLSDHIFNMLVGDGDAIIGMIGSSAMDARPDSFVSVALHYRSAEVDCNDNGIPDECDLESGSSTDCQSNHVPDECEVDTVFETGSGMISPVSVYPPQFFTIQAPPTADSDVVISFRVSANRPGFLNQIGIDLDDTSVGGVFSETLVSCSPSPFAAEDSLIVPASVFNNESLDGSVTIFMDGYTCCNIDPCPNPFIMATVSYERANVDCNSNSVPDECELAENDCNLNGRVDECDIDRCPAGDLSCADCDKNGIPDGCDIATEPAVDCPSGIPNGIPDHCEADCQAPGMPGNGSADSCDISDGTSADCNGNGVPDECEVDCDENGIEDSCDIANGSAEDCNENLIPDACDISSGASSDCEPDGIPDECQSDCNHNGVSDSCDLVSGQAPDCNGNSIPDECDLASGTSVDCNGNSVPDQCDIDAGTSSDCQTNGIPDECEADCNQNGSPDDCDLESGTSQDCNENLLPDECDIGGGTSIDCQPNGIPDECDIILFPDCNANNIPDDCDIQDQTSLDCQSNGIPDECEFSQFFSSASDNLSPLDNTISQSYWLRGPPAARENVMMTFTASGDLNGNFEYVEIYINDSLVGRVFEFGFSACATPPSTDTLFLTPASFNAAASAGDVLIEMTANLDVNAGCDVSFIAVTVEYEALGASLDCNFNGVPDVCELANGKIEDCNDNGIPDTCETSSGMDCNLNGIPDDCETDCNINGVPDECDLTDGSGTDCNASGILDECELADGTATDCNLNGILDECDIAEGTSLDCQSNDIPDDCEVGFVFSRSSDELSPFDAENPQSHRFDRPPIAGGDVTLTVSASADLDRSSEFVVISLNEMEIGTLFVSGGEDCVVPPNTDSLVISATDFNEKINGGDAVIAMVPSIGLDPGLCAETFAAVEMSYVTVPTELDCNDTGVPDNCENLGLDYDGSGRVDLGDYGFLVRCLAGPQSTPQPDDVACVPSCLGGFDFDADADIDLKDASEFLRLLTP